MRPIRWCRRRALRARPRRPGRPPGSDGDRQRRRRHRGARAVRLAGSRQPALHARRPERRGARLGPPPRDLERDRHREGARRRGDLVPARRPGHRPPPRAHEVARARRPALDRDRPGRRRVRPGDAPAACHGRSPAHDRRDAGRGVLAPGVVRRPPSRGRGGRPALRGRRPRTACAGSARGDRGRVARRDRAEQPVHLDLADPRRPGDPPDRPAQAHAGRRRQPRDRRQGREGPRRRRC